MLVSNNGEVPMLRPRSPTASALLVLVLLAALPGCLELDNALSDPMLSQADPDLCGMWVYDNGNDTYFALIGLVKAERGAPSGLMNVVFASYTKADRAASSMSWQFTLTEINGRSYANLMGKDISTKKGYKEWRDDDSRKCSVIKYHLSGNTLTVWGSNQEAFTNAWKAGKFEDAGSFVGYIKQNGDAEFFSNANRMVFKRYR
jgi:hypothetical protein